LIWLLLATIGLVVGAFGTMIGVAGGFLLVPIVLFLYPDRSPATLTAMTLTVAFFNSLSGSIAYTRLRRIDFRSGVMFSLTAVPGAIAGAAINRLLNRDSFQLVFGIVLLAMAGYLLVRPVRGSAGRVAGGKWIRRLTDRDGNSFTYSYHRGLGMLIALGVGIVSGLLGIGGGIIHVPALTQVLGFPVHIATATSQFVVGTSTLAAGLVRLMTGSFSGVAADTLALAGGAVIGAQIGARLSRRISGAWIVRLLAVALAFVAIRLLLAPL
jgi:uncharacterized membrane protein YfcA